MERSDQKEEKHFHLAAGTTAFIVIVFPRHVPYPFFIVGYVLVLAQPDSLFDFMLAVVVLKFVFFSPVALFVVLCGQNGVKQHVSATSASS